MTRTAGRARVVQDKLYDRATATLQREKVALCSLPHTPAVVSERGALQQLANEVRRCSTVDPLPGEVWVAEVADEFRVRVILELSLRD